MRNKEKSGLPEIYAFYKKKFTKRERESSAFIDYKKFSSVIKDFNQELARLIIEEAIEFKMPLRLGYMRIRKYKKKPQLNPDGTIDKKNMSINWKATKDYWAKEYPGLNSQQLKEIPHKLLIYHLNEHTDGYGFMLYWNKKGSNADNRSVYSMVFTFSNNRHMARVLKGEKKIDYYE
jgi:hypothetical protein